MGPASESPKINDSMQVDWIKRSEKTHTLGLSLGKRLLIRLRIEGPDKSGFCWKFCPVHSIVKPRTDYGKPTFVTALESMFKLAEEASPRRRISASVELSRSLVHLVLTGANAGHLTVQIERSSMGRPSTVGFKTSLLLNYEDHQEQLPGLVAAQVLTDSFGFRQTGIDLTGKRPLLYLSR